MSDATSIPDRWISRRPSSPDVVRRRFAHLSALLAMLDRMEPGDELRFFTSPRRGWAHRAGVRGYAVIRRGRVVDRVATART